MALSVYDQLSRYRKRDWQSTVSNIKQMSVTGEKPEVMKCGLWDSPSETVSNFGIRLPLLNA